MSNIQKIQADRDKAKRVLEGIQSYLEDSYAGDELLKNLDWLRFYIEDLELEIECNKTLADEEYYGE